MKDFLEVCNKNKHMKKILIILGCLLIAGLILRTVLRYRRKNNVVGDYETSNSNNVENEVVQETVFTPGIVPPTYVSEYVIEVTGGIKSPPIVQPENEDLIIDKRTGRVFQ